MQPPHNQAKLFRYAIHVDDELSDEGEMYLTDMAGLYPDFVIEWAQHAQVGDTLEYLSSGDNRRVKLECVSEEKRHASTQK